MVSWRKYSSRKPKVTVQMVDGTTLQGTFERIRYTFDSQDTRFGGIHTENSYFLRSLRTGEAIPLRVRRLRVGKEPNTLIYDGAELERDVA